ncbi:acyltransferase family protein [Symbiopectobacterium sp. RP]|uniref:acyltransferase family protein n=1 Tax=Symbiopectobacterium sp. RP TaxID=3248553 RepID=UPI003D2D9D62
MDNKQSLYGLTIFRFITAFYVFVFHCYLRHPIDVPHWIARVLNNGAIGMTFFFVLSGFVMAWSSRNGIRHDYFKARLLRIYPAYLFMGIISLPFLFYVASNKIIPTLILFLSATQSWIPSSSPVWHFAGSWSVSTEFFFYMTFPLLFPIIKNTPKTALITAFIITSSITPLAFVFGSEKDATYFYVSPIHRLPEFIIGVSLGCMYSSGTRLKKKKSKVIILLLALTVLITISAVGNPGFMKRNFATVPATAAIIYVLACSNIKYNFITRPFIYLGEITYSFYLMQLVVLSFLVKNEDLFYGMDSINIWLILGLATLLLSMISYHFIEKRFSVKKTSNSKVISTSV